MLKRKQNPAKPAAPQAASKAAPEAASQEYRKPRADVYTVLLVVALLIIVLATVFLWMSMKEYDYMIKGGPTVPAAGTTLDVPRGIA